MKFRYRDRMAHLKQKLATFDFDAWFDDKVAESAKPKSRFVFPAEMEAESEEDDDDDDDDGKKVSGDAAC